MPKELFQSPVLPPTADQIKAARIRARLSQEAVAETIGCSQASIVFWEKGRSRPKRQAHIRLLWRLIEEHPEEPPTGS
jgi:DNA-binding transcriptional regulator YiaG